MLEIIRIRHAHAECNECPHVAEHRVFHFFFHLSDKLIGDDQIQPVFPRLRKNLGKIRGGKILKLVHIQIKIPALVFRYFLAAHRRNKYPRYEDES